MVIHKLIAFLRKDTFLSYLLDAKKLNQIVLRIQTTLLFNIYAIYFTNSFSHFFISVTLSFDTLSLSPMVIQFPCGICSKAVANNHQALKCDKCNLWIHIKCNNINKQTYNYLKWDSSHWFCITCTKEFLPFSSIENWEFAHTTLGKIIKFTHVSNTPKSIKQNFIQAINSGNNSSRYFTVNYLTALSYDKNKNSSVFHLNINSLQYHFDELQTYLSNCPIDFQILGISESRLKTDIWTTTNIQLPGFNIEHMPTKSANDGALLYIRDTINNRLRPDLNVEKGARESIFIEILQKHPKML